MNNLKEHATAIGRFFISAMFVMAGLNKVQTYEATQGYMDAMGVPGALLPVVIIAEVTLGLAVIVGFKTRLAALALAGFSALTALLFHADFSNQVEMTMFMKNFTIAGGFLILAANGAGAWSLDNRFVHNS